MTDFSSAAFHRMLVNDKPRSLAYQQAIAEVVRPGDTVLDIGAGSGILSLFACQAGAARVYAVERTSMANMARAMAQANGFEDRMHVLQQDIRDVQLPERVDVVVSELISQGLVGQFMESLTDYVRIHLLKPGGRIVPEDVDYFIAPACSPPTWASLQRPADDLYGLAFSPLRKPFFNLMKEARFDQCRLLATPQAAYRIDSATVTSRHRPSAAGQFVLDREDDCHGLLVWFRSRLSPNVVIDNMGMCRSWSSILFPLPQAVSVQPGMTLRYSLDGKQLSNGDCIYRWRSTFERPHPETGQTQTLASFAQSSLNNLRRNPAHA